MFYKNISQLLFITTVCYISSVITIEPNYNVHLFYYPWYGTPSLSKAWQHWNAGNPDTPYERNPSAGDIASNYWPSLGPYDSCDPQVLAQHMEWIRGSGVGTIITSWWGRHDYTARCVPAIMDAAHKQALKVGIHLEPYTGRTAESVVDDIQYIVDTYGKHPAYFRDPGQGMRDAFYVFSAVFIKNWTAIVPLKKDHILLAQPLDRALRHYFGGYYNYQVFTDHHIVDLWKGMYELCKNESLVWAPSVGPGYIANRASGTQDVTNLDRNNGTSYDDNWEGVFESGVPDWVSITSFNEWHEGTVIEPVHYKPPTDVNYYMSFVDAYNMSGQASEMAYLDRTSYWVKEFAKRKK